MKLLHTVKVPIRTKSESNKREHWAITHKRKNSQQSAIRFLFPKDEALKSKKLQIELVRIAPCKMDDFENLPNSLKHVVDAISDCLNPGLAPGRADRTDRFKFSCSQKKGGVREYGVEILIYEKD